MFETTECVMVAELANLSVVFITWVNFSRAKVVLEFIEIILMVISRGLLIPPVMVVKTKRSRFV